MKLFFILYLFWNIIEYYLLFQLLLIGTIPKQFTVKAHPALFEGRGMG